MVKDPASTLLKAGHDGGRVEGSGDNSRPRNASLPPSFLPSFLSTIISIASTTTKLAEAAVASCVSMSIPLGGSRPQYPGAIFFYRIQPIQILPVLQQFNGFNELDRYQLACLAFFGPFLKWPMDKDILVVRPCIAYIRSAARVYSEK